MRYEKENKKIFTEDSSVLVIQFHNKLEIRAGQIVFHPFINALVQFWTVMIFPIACLTCI